MPVFNFGDEAIGKGERILKKKMFENSMEWIKSIKLHIQKK